MPSLSGPAPKAAPNLAWRRQAARWMPTRRWVGGAFLGLSIAGCAPDAGRADPSSNPQKANERDALMSAAEDPRVRSFYTARDWSLAWTPRAAQDLRKALDGAPAHGLDARAFHTALAATAGPADRDAALTLTALSYAHALASGSVDPGEVEKVYTLPRNDPDVVSGLADALRKGSVSDWLDALPPGDPEYAALSKAYLRYRQAANSGPSPMPIQDGPLIRPGDDDPRIPAMAERLRQTGLLSAASAAGGAGSVYSDRLVAAVKRLQGDHALRKDGIVGPDTLDALNETAADRAVQLVVNLERRRWLRRPPPAERIDVNTAAASMVYLDGGREAWSGRVIVGRDDHATPSLQAQFDRIEVNPPWRVPADIARAEILPRGYSYMRRHDMHMEHGMVVQRPGPHAALGRVKLDLDDPYAIYLHDTPSKSLFEKADRHRSHGCIRVQHAVAFGRLLAASAGKGDRYDQELGSGDTRTLSLGREITVRLLYHTAFLDQDGAIRLVDDVYGWDQALAGKLGLAPRPVRRRPRLAIPLGP